jgi:hypothetical protein
MRTGSAGLHGTGRICARPSSSNFEELIPHTPLPPQSVFTLTNRSIRQANIPPGTKAS